jgi:hypothetical protein
LSCSLSVDGGFGGRLEELVNRIVLLFTSDRYNGWWVVGDGLEEASLAPNILPEDRSNGEALNMIAGVFVYGY